MKLLLLTMLVLLFSSATAAHYSRRHRRTLSAGTKTLLALALVSLSEHKKTSHLAGLRCLSLSWPLLTPALLPRTALLTPRAHST